jgi:hypothetical protein
MLINNKITSYEMIFIKYNSRQIIFFIHKNDRYFIDLKRKCTKTFFYIYKPPVLEKERFHN